jgi:hypothetical protein
VVVDIVYTMTDSKFEDVDIGNNIVGRRGTENGNKKAASATSASSASVSWTRPKTYWVNEFSGTFYNVHLVHPSGLQNPFSNTLFVIQAVITLNSLANIIVALSVLLGAQINNYVFILVSVCLWAIYILLFQGNMIAWPSTIEYSHQHNNEVFISYSVWVISSAVSYGLLGIWLIDKDDAKCCSHAHSNPHFSVDTGFREFISYYTIVAVILLSGIITLYCNIRGLVAHYYPEKLYKHADFDWDIRIASTAGNPSNSNGNVSGSNSNNSSISRPLTTTQMNQNLRYSEKGPMSSSNVYNNNNNHRMTESNVPLPYGSPSSSDRSYHYQHSDNTRQMALFPNSLNTIQYGKVPNPPTGDRRF